MRLTALDLPLLGAFALFFISGLSASYFYFLHAEGGGIFFPGILFTSCSFIAFVALKIRVQLVESLAYYLLMNLLCLAAIQVTFMTGYAGFVLGMATGGAGAIGVFMLTNFFIAKVRIQKNQLFVLGGCAFGMTVLCKFLVVHFFDNSLIPLLFHVPDSMASLLGEAFIFWQSIIGVKLFYELRRGKNSDRFVVKD